MGSSLLIIAIIAAVSITCLFSGRIIIGLLGLFLLGVVVWPHQLNSLLHNWQKLMQDTSHVEIVLIIAFCGAILIKKKRSRN
jgi:hypothetical protein